MERGVEASSRLAPKAGLAHVVTRTAWMAAIALGGLALAGWLLDVPTLYSGWPRPPHVTVNGAFLFVLLGLGLKLTMNESDGRQPVALAYRLGQALAILAAVVGALILMEYLLQRDFGIDELLIKDPSAAAYKGIPGRPSFPAALNGILLGMGTMLIDVNVRRKWLAQGLILLSVLITALALIGYICDVSELYGQAKTKTGNGMSARDSLGFLLLGAGLLCARPGRGLLTIVSSDTPGGMLARWLLLTPVIGLLLSGAIYVVLERAAGGESTLRVWGLGLSNLVFLTAPIWVAAHLLHVVGLERDQAHRELESRVEQRTAELTGANAALAAEVAERREAEEALMDRDRELRLVMDSGPTLISYVDVRCRYKRMNRGYGDWIPPGNDRAPGLHIREVLGEEAWLMVEPYVARALAGEVVTFEQELPLPNGPRWMRATYTPDKEPVAGQIRGFVVHALDIGPQKHAEQALREARDRLERQAAELERRVAERTVKLQETVGELEAFSYSVAHDMRAPLRGMQGFTQLLLESHASQLNAEARGYLERIASSARRMDLLIQDVLNYTRVLKTETLLARVDLDQLVHHLIATYPNWQSPGVEIRIQGPLPPVMGHEGFLTQCISNLVGNAIKFVAPGTAPRIRIGAEVANSGVTIWFEDNGIGIAAKDRDRIFRMFERLNPSDQYEGTGIGLTIVRKAAERMGGRVGFESEPEKGSKFWLELKQAL